jgi:hypothetical protein
MMAEYCRRYGDYTVRVFFDVTPEREAFERELVEFGVSLPLPHRSAWARCHPTAPSWFVGVQDGSGQCCGGFALQVNRSRALPGHLLLRTERYGAALDNRVREVGLLALAELARSQRRVLRVYLEVFSPEEDVRATIARTASRLGFRRPDRARSYENTAVLNLIPRESDIFSSLHSTARRHIRALSKKGFSICPIVDSVYETAMAALYDETLRRTGGVQEPVDWASKIELSSRHPELSRVIGTFEPGEQTPHSLVAFAWGCMHGDYATYAAAASTRSVSSKVPLTYGPCWDLICWAKRNGATWFDFGGITTSSAGHEDRLRGISDFKRYFSNQVIAVGDEWILEPSPLRGRLAKAVGASAAWVRANLKRRSR